jgi:acetyl-CoA acetyltransferase
MRDVVIVEAARTPVGLFRGGFKGVRADHLGAAVLGELVQRAGITPEQVERVFKDIEAKRRATRYLHSRPLLVDAVTEV